MFAWRSYLQCCVIVLGLRASLYDVYAFTPRIEPQRTGSQCRNRLARLPGCSEGRRIHRFLPINRAVWSASALSVSVVAGESTLKSSFYLSRIVFLRAMALVHMVAFLVALRQNKALIGDQGITPARHILHKAEKRGREKSTRRLEWRKRHFTTPPFWRVSPTLWEQRFLRCVSKLLDSSQITRRMRELFWDRSDAMGRPLLTILWLPNNRKKLNPWLDGIALTGLSVASTVLILGSANVPLILALWLCQRSLMAVGGTWYGFGWEPQLAELSFHTLFLVPLLSLKAIPAMPVPALTSWTVRWLLFRVMLGAGLIKLRSGDVKWKNLTAMVSFYETQPVPNPLTRYMHWMPKWWHKGEVLINHFVELIAPWALIIPGLPLWLRRLGGLMQITFQAILISSGNLSFLNWLTMVPAILCLDDELLSGLFPRAMQIQAQHAVYSHTLASASPWQYTINLAFFALVARLSIAVVRNLLSKHQVMNSSFDPLRLINSYGAFGSVSEVRHELIISSAVTWDGEWKEYDFKVKPGNVGRRPRFLSPYHYRLDWLLWIASFSTSLDRNPWMYALLQKLLSQDTEVLKLISSDPWTDSPEKPQFIKVDQYRYKFHRREERETNPPYWDREFVRRIYPRQGLSSLDDLQHAVDMHR